MRCSVDMIEDNGKIACFRVLHGETAEQAFAEIVSSPQPGYFVQFGWTNKRKRIAIGLSRPKRKRSRAANVAQVEMPFLSEIVVVKKLAGTPLGAINIPGGKK